MEAFKCAAEQCAKEVVELLHYENVNMHPIQDKLKRAAACDKLV